jgi:hypothetical protein
LSEKGLGLIGEALGVEADGEDVVLDSHGSLEIPDGVGIGLGEFEFVIAYELFLVDIESCEKRKSQDIGFFRQTKVCVTTHL